MYSHRAFSFFTELHGFALMLFMNKVPMTYAGAFTAGLIAAVIYIVIATFLWKGFSKQVVLEGAIFGFVTLLITLVVGVVIAKRKGKR